MGIETGTKKNHLACVMLALLALLDPRVVSAKASCEVGGFDKALDKAQQVMRKNPVPRKLAYAAHRALGGKLKAGEFDALRAYTTDAKVTQEGMYGYDEINTALRSGNLTNGQRAYVEKLNEALEKLEPYNGKVYRSVGLLPEKVKRSLRKGEVFSDPGYVSTSKYKWASEHVSSDVDGFLFEIRTKTCRKVGFIANPRLEFEVLCPPGTKFKVVSTKLDGYKTIVQMEEVADPAALERIAKRGPNIRKAATWTTIGAILAERALSE